MTSEFKQSQMSLDSDETPTLSASTFTPHAPAKGAPADADKIWLDIGGRVFVTTAGTLRSQKDSYFASLLSGRFPIVYDADGCIFVDREPDHFKHILGYMRDGDRFDVTCLGLEHDDLQQLCMEAEFYGLSGLMDKIKNVRSTLVRFDDSQREDVHSAIAELLRDGFRVWRGNKTSEDKDDTLSLSLFHPTRELSDQADEEISSLSEGWETNDSTGSKYRPSDRRGLFVWVSAPRTEMPKREPDKDKT